MEPWSSWGRRIASVRRSAGLLGLVFVVAACSTGLDPEIEDLVGEWDWVESSGGIAGLTLTPASTGETMTLRFTESGVVELSRDGAVTSTSDYTVSTAEDGKSRTVAYTASPFGFPSQTLGFDGEDVMVLSDPCCDGFTYRWVRR